MRWCVLATVALSACGGGGGAGSPTVLITPSPSPSATPDPDPVIAAAGDIACGSATPRSAPCRHMETSELLIEIRPSAVLALGDDQYEFGEYQDFLRFYDPSWGRLLPITRPAPGNHEYQTRDANGYFDYFNGQGRNAGVAGFRGEGWYSFEVGSWHLISLNSNCESIAGGCGAGSPQLRWLRADLQQSRAVCTLAYWHHPRFSSGKTQNDRTYQPFWEALYEANADVVLVGHDHGYERFAPQGPNAQADAARGIRQFVVGTGGHSFQDFATTLPNSEVRNNNTFGVIKMRLRPGRYEWAFQPIPGGSFTDSGSGVCH
jgi:hypothetical protein